ncbi:MAG: hypothetical protein QOF58_1783 [Pseudonocardiales bacterium]|jgi:hypothetical protein|nr:hypothetical protein [Pseudonocardiales bacterium]
MATTHEDRLTYDEVLDRVLAADPETFYAQAKAFEQATAVLDDAKMALAKLRRQLEEGWSNGVSDRFVRIERLVREVEVLLADMPAYPRLLRRTGDTIVDSRQRLLALRHMPVVPHNVGVADKIDRKALSDRDSQARRILGELSTSYLQIGGEMPELPKHTVTGQLVLVPPLRQPTAGMGGAGSQVVSSSTRSQSAHPRSFMGKAGSTELFAPQNAGEPARPEQQAAFGRFATLATRSAPTVPAQKTQSFNGFSALADPADSAAVVLGAQGRGLGPAPSTEEDKGTSGRKHLELTHLHAGLDGTAAQLTAEVKIPASLESAPPVEQPAAAPPDTSAAPAAAQALGAKPQITLTSTTAPAPAVPTPAAPTLAAAAPAAPAAAAPAPPPGPPSPPAVPATSAPQPNPFAMAANPGLAAGAGSAASTARPPLGAALGAGLSAPAPTARGPEVWLRADTNDWANPHQAVTRLGRDGADQVPSLNGGTCATGHGKEVR